MPVEDGVASAAAKNGEMKEEKPTLAMDVAVVVPHGHTCACDAPCDELANGKAFVEAKRKPVTALTGDPPHDRYKSMKGH